MQLEAVIGVRKEITPAAEEMGADPSRETFQSLSGKYRGI
jgi:hypothetical protein